VVGLCCATAILLVPVSVAMLVEKVTAHDLFAFLGGVRIVRSMTTAAYSANNRGNHDGRLFAGIARGEGFAGSPVDVNPVERVAPFE